MCTTFKKLLENSSKVTYKFEGIFSGILTVSRGDGNVDIVETNIEMDNESKERLQYYAKKKLFVDKQFPDYNILAFG